MLTATGMQQLFTVGTALRTRYVESLAILDGNYSREELYVRSTNYDRTLMSAQSLLTGLYPPGEPGVPCTVLFSCKPPCCVP